MFFILGSDGKEYGPVTAGKLHEWISGGRANQQTKARRASETEWKTIGDFPELAQFSTGGSGGGMPPPAAVEVAETPAPVFAASTPAAPVVAVAEMELAGRGIRLGSFLLDRIFGVICALPGLVLLGPAFIAAVLAASRREEPDFSGMAAGGMLLGLALLCLFSFGLLAVQIWLLSTRGQSLGKIIVGIRIVRVPDETAPGFVHGWLLRNLVPGIIQILPWVGFVFFLVDACFIFSNERRCLHDLIAGTKVVKA